MATKIYKDGNYLIIDNGVSDPIEVLAATVTAEQGVNNRWYLSIDRKDILPEPLLESDITDESGAAYADFAEWVRLNTGQSEVVTITGTVDTGLLQPLTDSQLRASAVPVQITSQSEPFSFDELLYGIRAGSIAGSIIQKSGRNPSITSASAPEDMWNGSTLYSGFPTGAPEQLEFFSSSASDTGTLTYLYLATSESTSWQTATITLSGTTPVYGVTAFRVHSASYNNGNATTFNAGTITCRHRTTTANIFLQMPIGRSQTYVAAYTIPKGSKGYLYEMFSAVYGTSSVACETIMAIRNSGQSFRLRRNGIANNTTPWSDLSTPLYLDATNGHIDIVLRILSTTAASANTIIGGFNVVHY